MSPPPTTPAAVQPQLDFIAPDTARLSALVDESPEAIAVLDGRWRYVYVNRSFTALLPPGKQHVLGLELWKVSPQVVGTPFEKQLRAVMSARHAARMQFRNREGRSFDIHALPFGDGMAFFSRDVTDLNAATEEVLQSEERFRAILNTEPGCVILLDRGGCVLDTNPAGLEMLQVDGYDDLVGRPLAPFIAIPDRALLTALNDKVFAGGSETIVIELVGCHGRRRRVEHRAVPLHDGGTIVAALSITTDITERYETEATLRNRSMQHAVLASLGALALRDPNVEELTRRATDAVADVLRVPPSTALDLLRNQGLTGLEPPPVASADATTSVDLAPEDHDFVRSAAHLVSSAIERRRAEDALIEREQQLRQAQKMEAIGQLAGGVAHDFNNLLTVINVHTDLLLMQLAEPDPMRVDIEEIARAAARAASLTRQLLTFSRKQVVQPQVLDLARVVRGVEPMLRRLIGEDVEFETIVEHLDSVLADEGEIEQVLINLVVNARDAMPQGGRVRVEVRNVTVDDELCARHPSLRGGEYVQLTVADTGMGMTTETMMRAFEPFYTTKEPGRGTGLGLATVYGVVKQCGGAITVDSAPGQGTTFKVYLPVTGGTAPSVSVTAERRVPTSTGETILLVEDEDSVRRLARRVLESQGYTVLEAINGEDALRIAQDYAGVIDLLLSDVVMPEVGGRMLAERLSGTRPDIEVLFMSGYTDDDILRRGLLERGQRLIQKPFTATALSHEVRAVLDAKKRRRSTAHTQRADE